MTDINILPSYIKRIERLLETKDAMSPKRLFDEYLALYETKDKEAFVLALIWMLVAAERYGRGQL